MKRAWLAWALAIGAAGGQSLEYSRSGGVTLALDHYGPATKTAARHPAAVLIHGGGFNSGSNKDPGIVQVARLFARAGYAVFAIDYRLAPLHPYPAALDDVGRAIRYVRLQARRWNVDPRRIALIGFDAGGYLAGLAAVQPGSEVQAVVSVSAPSDFRGWPVSPALRDFLAPLIAAKGLEHALAEASPVMHIRPDAPPFLLIHGDADTVVPVVQSTHWQNALQAAGVRCNLILIGGGGQGSESWAAIPGVRDWEAEAIDWLGAALGLRTSR